MMNGDFPPSSSERRLWLAAVAPRIARPTSVEPVNAILSTSGCLTSASPVDAVSRNDVDHSRGQPSFLTEFGEHERGQRSELRWLQHDRVAGGQSRRNLPRQHQQRKIPRDDLPHNSARLVLRKFLIEQLRPTGVIVEMPRHQRNINVATLADGLAVVHRLQHGEQPRMLLHQPRQRIKIARASMRSQRAPFRSSSARRTNRRVHISSAALRDGRQFLPG